MGRCFDKLSTSVFTRNEYKDIFLDSLRYCQKEKGLEIIAWCIMTNHVHLLFRTDCKEIWKRLSQEIREKNKDFINFKQVRTSVNTHWLKQFNLRQVPYMAGHRYVSSTEAFLVNQTDDLQKDIDEFYPF